MDLEEEFKNEIMDKYDSFVRSRAQKNDAFALMKKMKDFLDSGLDLNTPKYPFKHKLRSAAEIIFNMLQFYDTAHNQELFIKELFEKYEAKVSYKMLKKAVLHEFNCLPMMVEKWGDVNEIPKGKMPLLEFAIDMSLCWEAFETLLIAGADMHALTRDSKQTIEEKLYTEDMPREHESKYIEIYEHFCGGKSLKAAKITE